MTNARGATAEKMMMMRRDHHATAGGKAEWEGMDLPWEMLLQFKKEESVGVVVFVFSAGGARRPASARSPELSSSAGTRTD